MTNPNLTTAGDSIRAAGNELYARQSCHALAENFGVDAVPAYDEHGFPTGQVAVDPTGLESAIRHYVQEGRE